MTAYPKTKPWRSEAYRRLVASQPCERCGIDGYSQAAHADMGKGMGTKTGDETCYAACGPHAMNVGRALVVNGGCHTFIGRVMTRDARRETEAGYARATRARLRPLAESMGIDLPQEQD